MMLSCTMLAEFNSEAAAARFAELLIRLQIPTDHEVITAGVRRRYRLHRLHVPDYRQSGVMLASAWWQGRKAVLSTVAAGSSARRHARRPILAAAAWRAALLAAGRHPSTHTLGVRVCDAGFAAVLVRGAHLLGASASVARRSGCLLVTVPASADKERILRHLVITVTA